MRGSKDLHFAVASTQATARCSLGPRCSLHHQPSCLQHEPSYPPAPSTPLHQYLPHFPATYPLRPHPRIPHRTPTALSKRGPAPNATASALSPQPSPPPHPPQQQRPATHRLHQPQTPVLLPLPTALAKLRNDPRLVCGWQVRVLEPTSGHRSRSCTSLTSGRHRPTPTPTGPTTGLGAQGYIAAGSDASEDLIGSSTAGAEGMAGGGQGLGGRLGLGQVVEVLLPTASGSDDGAEAEVEGEGMTGATGVGVGRSRRLGHDGGGYGALREWAVGGSYSSGKASNGGSMQSQVMLRVLGKASVPDYDFEGTAEYLVRLDPEVVPYADVAARTLFVGPSKALLAQGQRQLQLQLLRRELLQYCTANHPPEAAVDFGDPTDAKPSSAALQPYSSEGSKPYPLDAVMPSRQRLLAAGRRDLVDLVARAGGTSEVALALGLRSSRRPRGYWRGQGALQRLDRELAAFVAAGWLQLPHPEDPGRTYWYNQVSGRTTWRRPQSLRDIPVGAAAAGREGGRTAGGGPGSSYIISEAAADRVMPSRALLLAAKRCDLHAAVLLHGGYLAVAERLGRTLTWATSSRVYVNAARLRRQLATVADDLGLEPGMMPTERELLAAGSGGLLVAVRRAGGLHAVAERLRQGWRGRRRPRGFWDDEAALAEELAAFAARSGGGGGSGSDDISGGGCGGGGGCGSGGSGGVGCGMEGVPKVRSHKPRDGRAGRGHEGGGAALLDSTSTPLLLMPTRQQLRAAGRFDLLYALDRRAAQQRRQRQVRQRQVSASPAQVQPASAGGPQRLQSVPAGGPAAVGTDGAIPIAAAVSGAALHVAGVGCLRAVSRQGSNRGALHWEDVESAIRAGCHSPQTVREHLFRHAATTISRAHLNAYMLTQAREGRLVKRSYGKYDLPDGAV